MVTRMPLNEVLSSYKPERVVVFEDGASVTLMGPLGVEEVTYPAYDPTRRTLLVNQSDCDTQTQELSMAADASVAILPENLA